MFHLFPDYVDEDKVRTLASNPLEITFKITKEKPSSASSTSHNANNATSDTNTNSKEEDTKAQYEKLTVAELKSVLRSKGLKISGRKSDLIERLSLPSSKKRKLKKMSDSISDLAGSPFKKPKISDSLRDDEEDDYEVVSSKCGFCDRESTVCLSAPCFKKKIEHRMPSVQTGKCYICETRLNNTEIRQHYQLDTPIELNENSEANWFIIKIWGLCYWTVIRVTKDSTLKDLDLWLRKIWLECCGHASVFKVENTDDDMLTDITGVQTQSTLSYWSTTIKDSYEKKLDMESVILDTAFVVGQKLEYIYDLENPTFLFLTIEGEGSGPLICQGQLQTENKIKPDVVLDDVDLSTPIARINAGHLYMQGEKVMIEVLARNEAPNVPCVSSDCGLNSKSNALFSCTKCSVGNDFFCIDHIKNHQHPNSINSVVNSPRVGMCSYAKTRL